MPDAREQFSFEEMVAEFDWARVNTVGPVFDLDKLDWLNGEYMRGLAEEDLAARLVDRLVQDGGLPPDPGDDQREVGRRGAPVRQDRLEPVAGAAGRRGVLLGPDTQP